MRVAKGQSAPTVVTQPPFMGSQTASDWNHFPQPVEQQSNSAPSFVPETVVEPAEESYALEEEGLVLYLSFYSLFIVLQINLICLSLYSFEPQIYFLSTIF